MSNTTTFWNFVEQLAPSAGGGGSEAKPARPAVAIDPTWISKVHWCPSCLILLPLGLRALDGGGYCPGCGELWESETDFPPRGFRPDRRPCPRWHLKPCSCQRRHRKDGGR
jgi:hypothetical protein